MSEPIFRISFFNQNEVYEVYAKQIFQSEMYGFIEIEEFVFGERSQVVVDPGEEKLKQLADELHKSHGTECVIVPMDLVEENAAQAKSLEASKEYSRQEVLIRVSETGRRSLATL